MGQAQYYQIGTGKMKKPEAQTVGLQTLDIRGTVALKSQHTAIRANKKRVFTDDEWAFLNSRTDEDLMGRVKQGDNLIALLHSPQMMNIVPGEAPRVASNLRYQQDAILSILKSRKSSLVKE
jgi:hypothetical protein